jgi:hypothetical protein
MNSFKSVEVHAPILWRGFILVSIFIYPQGGLAVLFAFIFKRSSASAQQRISAAAHQRSSASAHQRISPPKTLHALMHHALTHGSLAYYARAYDMPVVNPLILHLLKK